MFFLKMFRKAGPKVLIAAIGLMIIFVSILPQGYTDRMSTIFDFSKDSSGSAQIRKATTIQALQILLEHPILGVGLGQNVLALNDRGFYWQRIHNVYLEIGAELGIIPMFIFIILLWKLIRNMRFIQKESVIFEQKQEIVLLAQAIEISLIGFAVGAVFHPVAYHFYFYYLAGFGVAIKKTHNNFQPPLSSPS
jgi:O-antigen ligase